MRDYKPKRRNELRDYEPVGVRKLRIDTIPKPCYLKHRYITTMEAKMRAAHFYGGKDIRVETVPDPTPAPEQVLVKVHAAGICGSDLHGSVKVLVLPN